MSKEQAEAVERIREACAGVAPVDRMVLKKDEQGQPLPVREANFVALLPGDVVLACEASADSDIVRGLKKGCLGRPVHKIVHVMRVHVQHLLEQVDGRAVKAE